MEQSEIIANRKRMIVLKATIREKHNLTTRNFPSPVEDGNESKLSAQIAGLVKDIHPDFLFPKEYTDSAEDQKKGMFEYHDSPLHRAIAYGDNETASLIIAKEGIKPKHFVIKGKVPSLEQAMGASNEAIATFIMEHLSPEMQAKYKKDFIATFGEGELTDAIQTKEPIEAAAGKKKNIVKGKGL